MLGHQGLEQERKAASTPANSLFEEERLSMEQQSQKMYSKIVGVHRL
jgi:hypothetical protein